MDCIDLSEVKGLIFDYGGTLDSKGDHWSHVIWKGYENASVMVPYDAFRDAYVYAERELARTRHILPGHDFHDLMLIKVKVELQRLAEGKFIDPGEVEGKARMIAAFCYQAARGCIGQARPVLEALGRKYPMVLVSNFYGNIHSVLGDFGLGRYFVKVIESAIVGVRKPDPRIFELGLQALGLPAHEVVVVGDSYKKDILPALSLHCHALWLKGRGWTAQEDAQSYPHVITSLSQLLVLLGGA